MDRIQRSRQYPSPPDTHYFGRPTKYGNKHRIYMTPDHRWGVEGIDYDDMFFDEKRNANEWAVELYKRDIEKAMKDNPEYLNQLKRELSPYKHLSCFCPLDMPCHVDYLIELIQN